MQEGIGGEILSLDLGLSISCFLDTTKKRKRRDDLDLDLDHDHDDGHDHDHDVLLNRLIEARERMFRVDPDRRGLEDGKGLQLIHLLLISATAVDGGNLRSAVDSLVELYQNVSLNGDPIQRVTAYFADGLAARLLTSKSPFYDEVMEEPSLEEEFTAFTELYQASPYYQFAHFTANQAIIEVFEEEEEENGGGLHVVDFDVCHGFQWPSLIQSLSDKATSCRPVSLRITGYGRSLEELKETEERLASFAKGCHNLVFEFDGLLRGSTPCDIKITKNSTLVVNLVFYLHTLTTSEISRTLMDIHSLKPSAVVLVEKEGNRSARSFLSGFMESLHYFAAMFDSLDDCLPADSMERLRIEKNHLGREIKGAIASNVKEEKHLRYERMETWKGRMESNRFKGVKLSSRSLSQAKLLLKIKSHCSHSDYANSGGFRIFERDEGRAISLGWQERHLITASTWRCAR